MKNKHELKLFIEKFLDDNLNFDVSEQDCVYNINFINCCNWPAALHHKRLKKIERLEKCLNELKLPFSINKIA